MLSASAKRILGIAQWRPGQLARNSIALLGWMLLRAAAQATTILILARAMGATDYGKFVAILAVASFLIPFIGLGLSHIVLRNGAKDPQHITSYFQYAAYWWAISLLPIIVLSVALAELLLPSGFPRIAAYAVLAAEMGATSLTELCARTRQANQKINAYGAINAGLPLIRLLALCLLFLLHENIDIQSALWTYAASSLAYILFLGGRLTLRKSKDHASSESMHPTSGLPLSLSIFSVRLQGEFNKPILAHLGFDIAGAYNIAQRAVEFAAMPIQSAQESLWPRLYAQPDPRNQLMKIGLCLLVLAILCGLCIWLTAPLLPLILGEDFKTSANIVCYLAWLPTLQVIRALTSFHAIYHEHMKLIGWACAAGAVAGVIGVTTLVPIKGVVGAITAAYTSELIMILWIIAGLRIRKVRQSNK